MIWRAALGVVAIAVGAVWIGQGEGSIHGSFMTGHQQYTGLGIVLVVVGAALIAWAGAVARRRRQGQIEP